MNDIDKRTLPKNPEVIKRISETKSEQSREIILEGAKNFNLEESDIQLAIPSHRKKNHISLEEYQSLLKKGKTVLEISKTTSKHLIYFYNTLLKGGINLSKEEFEKMYDSGIALDEIGKAKGISRESMTFLREFYGIKRKGATFQKRINKEVPLSQEAKDVIIGSMLGDGHITKWGYYSEKHSPEQLEYLKWKASFFKDITTDKSWDYYEAIDKRSGSLIKTHSFRTTAHSFIYEMRKLWYKEIDGKWTKVVPNEISEYMNEQILAIWFMDDGNTDWMYRNGKKEWKNAKPMAKICTDSFSEKDISILITVIFLKFGIKSYVGERNRITFNTENTIKLISLIKKYTHKNLLYKLDECIYSGKINKQDKL